VKPLAFIAVFFRLLIATQADAATETTTGLEVANPSSVRVLIEDVTDDGKKLGLSEDIIEARVNAVLRRNGLKPVEATNHCYYVVHVTVYGIYFATNVSFIREVTFNDGIGERSKLAKTWDRGSFGTIGTNPSGKVNQILDGVSSLTEVFANEFLKANRK
jgi:hypothetical protein